PPTAVCSGLTTRTRSGWTAGSDHTAASASSPSSSQIAASEAPATAPGPAPAGAAAPAPSAAPPVTSAMKADTGFVPPQTSATAAAMSAAATRVAAILRWELDMTPSPGAGWLRGGPQYIRGGKTQI